MGIRLDIFDFLRSGRGVTTLGDALTNPQVETFLRNNQTELLRMARGSNPADEIGEFLGRHADEGGDALRGLREIDPSEFGRLMVRSENLADTITPLINDYSKAMSRSNLNPKHYPKFSEWLTEQRRYPDGADARTIIEGAQGDGSRSIGNLVTELVQQSARTGVRGILNNTANIMRTSFIRFGKDVPAEGIPGLKRIGVGVPVLIGGALIDEAVTGGAVTSVTLGALENTAQFAGSAFENALFNKQILLGDGGRVLSYEEYATEFETLSNYLTDDYITPEDYEVIRPFLSGEMDGLIFNEQTGQPITPDEYENVYDNVRHGNIEDLDLMSPTAYAALYNNNQDVLDRFHAENVAAAPDADATTPSGADTPVEDVSASERQLMESLMSVSSDTLSGSGLTRTFNAAVHAADDLDFDTNSVFGFSLDSIKFQLISGAASLASLANGFFNGALDGLVERFQRMTIDMVQDKVVTQFGDNFGLGDAVAGLDQEREGPAVGNDELALG